MIICEALDLDRTPSRLLTTPQQQKTQGVLMTHWTYFQAKLEHRASTKARNQKHSSSDQRLARVARGRSWQNRLNLSVNGMSKRDERSRDHCGISGSSPRKPTEIRCRPYHYITWTKEENDLGSSYVKLTIILRKRHSNLVYYIFLFLNCFDLITWLL